jgi:hypothetical protein
LSIQKQLQASSRSAARKVSPDTEREVPSLVGNPVLKMLSLHRRLQSTLRFLRSHTSPSQSHHFLSTRALITAPVSLLRMPGFPLKPEGPAQAIPTRVKLRSLRKVASSSSLINCPSERVRPEGNRPFRSFSACPYRGQFSTGRQRDGAVLIAVAIPGERLLSAWARQLRHAHHDRRRLGLPGTREGRPCLSLRSQ